MLRLCVRLWLLLACVISAVAVADNARNLDESLPVDTSIQYRVLPNGMRYWIRPNALPAGKVSMWLRVGSGSINEDDDQRGLAHMLEHLAFNGSTNFPAGTLIKRFESAGLTFGAHQNATTGFLDTVYKLTIPNDPKMVDLGLLFFADVTHRLTLALPQVDQERAVVLAERRARDNAAKRAFNRALMALVPGSRFAERLPIGDEAVVSNATNEQLRRYYRKWYRPDNTVLLIAGDTDVATLDAMVRKQFGDWAPAADPAPDQPTGIRPYERDRVEIVNEYGLISADVNIAQLEPARDITHQRGFRTWMVQKLGASLINQRMNDLVLEGQAPFVSGAVAADTTFGATLVEAHAKGAPKDWEKTLRGLLIEMNRVRQHGFSDAEFAQALKVFRLDFASDALDEPDRAANHWLRVMEAAVEERRQPISARQQLELFDRFLPTITRAEVEDAVRARYATERRTFTLTLPRQDDLSPPSAAQLLKIVQSTELQAVAKLVERERPDMLLAKDPTPGTIVRQDWHADLDVHSVTLSNGVRIHFRPLVYKQDHVSVRIMVAGGRVNETPLNRGITEAAAESFRMPATRSLASVDIQRLLATKQVTVAGYDTAGALELDVEGRRQDLEDGFRLAYLLLTQARIEPAAFDTWQRQAIAREANREGSVDAQLNDRVDAFMTSNDPRFRELTPLDARRQTLAQAQAWLDHILATAPIEVAIVGDLSTDRALALAQQYLGSLPTRPSVGGAYADARRVAVAPGPFQERVSVDTATPKAMVYVGWRGPNWQDVRDWQLLDLAGRIVTNRLFAEVRERRGLAYSVRARSSSNTLYEGNGRFRVSFVVDPLKAEEAASVVQEVVDEFVRAGPSIDELRIAQEQATSSFSSTRLSPEFWLDILSDLDYMGGDLSWVQGYLDDVRRFTRADVMAVMKKYIRPDRLVRVIGTPAEFTTAVETAPKGTVATVN
ncbi:MAG: insulinase family protein [Gammaproteobacteria bacterium]|nr:insulinase family protein [Gammaproteobacteria bacterium]